MWRSAFPPPGHAVGKSSWPASVFPDSSKLAMSSPRLLRTNRTTRRMRGAPRRRFVPSKVSPAEFLVVIDDEPVSFQAHVILLNELVDHARDRFARCPGHVGHVLLEGEILNNHLSLLEQTDVVSQQQQNVCHASRSIFQRKALDLGVRLSKSHGQLRP